MKKIIVNIIIVFITIISIFSNTTSIAFAKKISDEDMKEYIVSAVKSMEVIMERSYSLAEKEAASLCENGYDYELTMESFYDQGRPFAGYDYRRFIAAYTTIQKYCYEKNIDMGEGINQINFIDLGFQPEIIKEYIPEKLPIYKPANIKGVDMDLYIQDGYMYVTEPCTITEYEQYGDSNYFVPGNKKNLDLRQQDTPYANITLSIIPIDAVYTVFNLNRSDFIDQENEALDKINNLMEEAKIDQNVFILRSTGASEEDRQIISHVSDNVPTEFRRTLVEIATSIVGLVPYEWGGKSTKPGFDSTWYTFDDTGRQKGLDCSGYAQWILRTAGYEGWRPLTCVKDFLTSDQLEPITVQDIKPGDFGMFYPATSSINHIGMYLGDGYWIHCSSTAQTVVISNKINFSYFRRLKDIGDPVPYDMDFFENEESEEDGKYVDFVSSDNESEPSEEINEEYDNEESEDEESEEYQNTIETEGQDGVIQILAEQDGEDISVRENTQHINSEDSEEIIQPENMTDSYNSDPISDPNMMLMAKIVYKESYGEGFNGWIGVAQVIRNRIISDQYPNDVLGVVSAKNQFATYSSALKMKDSDMDPDLYYVCEKVMSGELRIFDSDDVIGFKRASGNDDKWGRWSKYVQIGNHSFYTSY